MKDCSGINIDSVSLWVDQKKVELEFNFLGGETNYFKTKEPYELIVSKDTGRYATLEVRAPSLLIPSQTQHPNGSRWLENLSNPVVTYYGNPTSVYFPPGPAVVNNAGASFWGFSAVEGGYCPFFVAVKVRRKQLPLCPTACREQTVQVAPTNILYLKDSNGVMHLVPGLLSVGCDRGSAQNNRNAEIAIRSMIRNMFPECDSSRVGVFVSNSHRFPACVKITIVNSPIKFMEAFDASKGYKFDHSKCED